MVLEGSHENNYIILQIQHSIIYTICSNIFRHCRYYTFLRLYKKEYKCTYTKIHVQREYIRIANSLNPINLHHHNPTSTS